MSKPSKANIKRNTFKPMTISVNVTVPAKMRGLLWVGVKLIRLGAWLIGVGKVVTTEGEKP